MIGIDGEVRKSGRAVRGVSKAGVAKKQPFDFEKLQMVLAQANRSIKDQTKNSQDPKEDSRREYPPIYFLFKRGQVEKVVETVWNRKDGGWGKEFRCRVVRVDGEEYLSDNTEWLEVKPHNAPKVLAEILTSIPGVKKLGTPVKILKSEEVHVRLNNRKLRDMLKEVRVR